MPARLADRLPAQPRRHRRPDRRDRHHRGLVHRLLRTDPGRGARRARRCGSAVETGWQRARRTILAADFVSFLAAVVLYVLSVGGVRGFAFTLGLTTLVDIVVVFLFTKPLVTMLGPDEVLRAGPQVVRARPGAPRRPTPDDPATTRRRGAAAGTATSTARRPDEPPRERSARGSTAARSPTTSSPTARSGTACPRCCCVVVDRVAAHAAADPGHRVPRRRRVPGQVADGRRRTPSRSHRRATSSAARSSSSRSAPDTCASQTETLDHRRGRGGAQTRSPRSSASAADDVEHAGHRPELGQGHLEQGAARRWSFFLLGVVVFLSLYFEWKMALAAMIALLHDLVITAGLYSLVGFEVTPATVIGFLTILGYSLYDTVVVFDKVRENTAGPRRRQPDDVQRGHQPGGEPDPGPLDQHLDHRAAADRRDPVRRRRAARCRAAQGPRRSRCSSVWPSAPTRRSSSRRRCSPTFKEREPAMQALAKRVAGRRAGTGVEAPSARRRAAAAQPAADQDARPRRTRRRRRGRARRSRRRPRAAPPRRPAGGAQRSQPRKGSGGRNKSKKRR